MSLFEPGPEPLPWLGKMAQLGPISGITQIRFYLSCLCFLFAILNGSDCAVREMCDLCYGYAVVSDAGFVYGKPQESLIFELLTLQLRGYQHLDCFK